MGVPVTQRLDPGLNDVVGGIEIGLADLEVDYFPAGGFQGLGPREHLECGLGSQPAHGGGKAMSVDQLRVLHGHAFNSANKAY